MDDLFEDLFGDNEETVQSQPAGNATTTVTQASNDSSVEQNKEGALASKPLSSSSASSSDSSSSDSSDSESSILSDEEEAKVAVKKKTQFDEVLDRLKRKRPLKRGKKDTETDEVNKAESVDRLVKEMFAAASHDLECIEAGKPGLSKLSMLQRVQEFVMKQSFQESFIDNGGLKAFYQWLRLLPDGSLPNLTLRSSIIRLIERLIPYIAVDNLKESKLAWAINDSYHHHNETLENKRILYGMISTWLHLVRSGRGGGDEDRSRRIESSSSYGGIAVRGATKEEMELATEVRQKKEKERMLSLRKRPAVQDDDEDEDVDSKGRTRVSKKRVAGIMIGGMNEEFKLVPVSKVDEILQSKGEENSRLLKSLRNPSKAKKR